VAFAVLSPTELPVATPRLSARNHFRTPVYGKLDVEDKCVVGEEEFICEKRFRNAEQGCAAAACDPSSKCQKRKPDWLLSCLEVSNESNRESEIYGALIAETECARHEREGKWTVFHVM